jgi:hypothetical protein
MKGRITTSNFYPFLDRKRQRHTCDARGGGTSHCRLDREPGRLPFRKALLEPAYRETVRA